MLHLKSVPRRLDLNYKWIQLVSRDRPDRYKVDLFIFPGSSSKLTNIFGMLVALFLIRLDLNQEIYNFRQRRITRLYG